MMAVVREFVLPDLGEGLVDAEIVRWLVRVGDVVAVDQPVVEVETAKALVEVPCPYGGVVTALFADPGEEIPVGRPLLTVAVGPQEPAESGAGPGSPGSVAGLVLGAEPGAAGAEGAGDAALPARSTGPDGSGNVLVGYGTAAPGARRRRIRPAPVWGSPAPALPGTGSGRSPSGSAAASGRGARAVPTDSDATDVTAVTGQDGPDARDARDAPTRRQGAAAGGGVSGGVGGPVAVISPLVRRIARAGGVDLRTLAGTGPDGLILRTDVERALAGAPERAHSTTAETARSGGPVPATSPVGTAPVGGPPNGAVEVRIPLRGIRGAVAEKLSRSRQEIPDATCWVDADASELLAARAAMNEAPGPRVSVLALLARICTAALVRYPELNSTVDSGRQEIVRLSAVHLGFAAQTERGLVVPVVRDAHTRSTDRLSAEIARLTGAARAGSLTPAELSKGTFTLNNYGVLGVDGSTPIINHPQAAMLGVGRITPKPWVHQGGLAVRQVVQLSLTFDHRVCDGGTAGGFLRFIADCVERPAMLIRAV